MSSNLCLLVFESGTSVSSRWCARVCTLSTVGLMHDPNRLQICGLEPNMPDSVLWRSLEDVVKGMAKNLKLRNNLSKCSSNHVYEGENNAEEL